jgi:hypothetical protein
MAEKESYPTIPAKQWWGIRNKFKQSIPPNVTQGYLAAALSMGEDSARTNILPALRAMKIIDQDGKPLERAKQWRDDEQYSSVCDEIRQEIYPSELVHALTPPSPNREAVERWIANKTGAGESAAGKMASLYLLLCEADPKAGQDVTNVNSGKPTQKASKHKPAFATATPKSTNENAANISENIQIHAPKAVSISKPVSSLHIDIQIHIAADSSNAQIDQIFASMAKHLGKLINQDNE